MKDMKNHWMTNTITQVSILNALLARQFDGYMPCSELLEYGDHGTGTFDRMDGEMIILDGSIYQIKADGKVYTPDLANRTPFATVCHFRPDQTWSVNEPVELEALGKMIDEKAPNQNAFCAIRVQGSFSYMNTHALPIQSKPYPPTAEVVLSCPQFEMRGVSGTIIGFRCPPYVRGINDPGYHLHFLSDDKTQGGHIRAFVMDQGVCAINTLSNHLVILPENGASLAGIDLSRDLVTEFHDQLSQHSHR
jgi:acetolactate decarboxylase